MLIDCTKVRELWLQIERWIKDNISGVCKISDMDKVFGQRAKEEIIDKIITATKAEIYNNRKTSKKHVINDIKRILFHQLRLEEYEASLIQKEDNFFEIGGKIYGELTTLFSTN